MHSGPRSRALALAAGIGLALAALTGAPRDARAQPSPETRAAAAALFEDGRRLMGEGRLAEACPKLEESQRIDPGIGTLFNVALCLEAMNRTASAWVDFRDVAAQALAAGQSDREKVARGRAAALEPKLMRLKITMSPGASASSVEVKRDGAVVSPAMWGTPVPLDPGKHQVTASAPGKEPWEVTVVLDQPGGVVSVDVPLLLDRKAAAPGAGPVPPPSPLLGAPAQGPAPLPPPRDEASPRSWQRPLGVTATILGAAGLGVGVGVGFLAKSAKDASNQGNCDEKTNACNQAGLAQRADAVKKGDIATGVFVAGAVLAAGGVVLWITAPPPYPAHKGGAAAWGAPAVGLGPGSAALRWGSERGRWWYSSGMASPMTLGLVGLLVASVALNARLLLHQPEAKPEKPCPVCAPVAPTPARVEPGDCEARLAACQKQSWDLAARAIAQDHAPHKPATPNDAGANASTRASQRAALCARAESMLHDTWLRDKDLITAGLAQSLGDPAEQERNVTQEVERMREATGLTAREAAVLESDYRDKRLTRVAASRAALARDPHDLGAVVDQARGLFADEDALLVKAGGDAARDAWRAEQVESRTVFLAILATMADKSWDDSIGW